jgi:septation ring formation regulator EzrA
MKSRITGFREEEPKTREEIEKFAEALEELADKLLSRQFDRPGISAKFNMLKDRRSALVMLAIDEIEKCRLSAEKLSELQGRLARIDGDLAEIDAILSETPDMPCGGNNKSLAQLTV